MSDSLFYFSLFCVLAAILGALLFAIATQQIECTGDSLKKDDFRRAKKFAITCVVVFGLLPMAYVVVNPLEIIPYFSQTVVFGSFLVLALLVLGWVTAQRTAYGDDLALDEIVEDMFTAQIRMAYAKMRAAPEERHSTESLYDPIYHVLSFSPLLANFAAKLVLQWSGPAEGGIRDEHEIVDDLGRLIPTQEEFSKRLVREARKRSLKVFDSPDSTYPLSGRELKNLSSFEDLYFQISEPRTRKWLPRTMRLPLLPGR